MGKDGTLAIDGAVTDIVVFNLMLNSASHASVGTKKTYTSQLAHFLENADEDALVQCHESLQQKQGALDMSDVGPRKGASREEPT